MTHKLLYTLALLSFSLCFSQDFGTFHTNNEGRISFTTNVNSILEGPVDYRMPMDLDLDWSEPEFNISQNELKDSWSSRMDVGSNGNVYIVYNDNHTNGLQKIMFRKKVENDWSNAIFVDTGTDIGGRNNHFPAITASDNGDLHVTYNVWAFENVRNFVGYSYYNAASDSWSDGIKISDLNGTVNNTFSRHDIYSTADNLPVVVWGFDNRENEPNEEIYLTYFDGNNWSNDIPVSDLTDGEDAGYPYMKSMGNNQAMIVYSENLVGGAVELRYRIYNDQTHELSEAKAITTNNIFRDNYTLTVSESGKVSVLTMHKMPGGAIDIFTLYVYDNDSDSFNLSSHSYEINSNAGGLAKRMDFDCNANNDCGLIFSDFFQEKFYFVPYNEDDGFGMETVLLNIKVSLEFPTAKFDTDGNLHITWCDMRFDDGQGFDEREVFYKKGRNNELGLEDFSFSELTVFPNPSDGIFTIQTEESYTLEIYNILGKLLDSRFISGPTQIENLLPTGTYILHFANENGSWSKKLIIK